MPDAIRGKGCERVLRKEECVHLMGDEPPRIPASLGFWLEEELGLFWGLEPLPLPSSANI